MLAKWKPRWREHIALSIDEPKGAVGKPTSNGRIGIFKNMDHLRRYGLVLDSGSTVHMCRTRRMMHSLYKEQSRIRGCNGDVKVLEEVGSLGKLKNVIYNPDSPKTLISVSCLLQEMDIKIIMEGSSVYLHDSANKLISTGIVADGLVYLTDYNLILDDDGYVGGSCFTVSSLIRGSCQTRLTKLRAKINKLNVLHNRFGHWSERKLKRLVQHGKLTGIGVSYNEIKDLTMEICDACMRGKMSKVPVTTSKSVITSKPFERVGSDLAGRMSIRSIHGSYYIAIFVDYHTDYVAVSFIAEKSKFHSRSGTQTREAPRS